MTLLKKTSNRYLPSLMNSFKTSLCICLWARIYGFLNLSLEMNNGQKLLKLQSMVISKCSQPQRTRTTCLSCLYGQNGVL